MLGQTLGNFGTKLLDGLFRAGSTVTDGSGFISNKKLKVVRNKNLNSNEGTHRSSQLSHMSNEVSQISSDGNTLEEYGFVRSVETENSTAFILPDVNEPIQTNGSKTNTLRFTSHSSIIDAEDSDSSGECFQLSIISYY